MKYRSVYVIALSLTIVFVVSMPGFAQNGAATARPRIHRNLRLERNAARRLRKLTPLFQPEAKQKLSAASGKSIRALIAQPAPADVLALARNEVETAFPGMSVAQSNLMTFSALADVARIVAALRRGDDNIGGPDALSEMGEMESLSLQMILDRRSKFMTALSNIMKKIANTSDNIIKNLK